VAAQIRRASDDASPASSGGGGQWMGSAGLSTGFLFFSILLTMAGIWSASINHLIYRDHECEADRLAHLEKLILPTPENNFVVVSDADTYED